MTAVAGKTNGTAQQPRSGSRILIVDDEKRIRDVFRRLISLSLPGCRIDVAGNGVEAVQAFRSTRYPVLVMDVKMPVMDGATAFQEIRKLCEEEGWDMPSVIFCTGYDPSGAIRDIVKNSTTHCLLMKPVGYEQLLEAIQSRLPVS